MDDEDSEAENPHVMNLGRHSTITGAGGSTYRHTSNGCTEENDEAEFCDICSMELINHPDEVPCPPHDGYVKEHAMCPVCCQNQPTREHVASHFLQELIEFVRDFDPPLTCEKCEDYTTETERTLAIHLALSHNGITPYLEDAKLLSSKRRAAGVIDRQEAATLGHSNHRPPPPQIQVVNNHLSMGERERIKCDFCDVLFTRKDSKKKHIKRFHSALVKGTSDGNGDCVNPSSRYNPLGHGGATSDGIMNGAGEGQNAGGDECPVCTNPLTPAREKDHIIWHFIHELRELVGSTCEETIEGEFECNECSFMSEGGVDSMAKHCALLHGKLDILLADENLMAEKRRRCLSTQRKKNTKRISNELCPICDFKDPSR